MSAFRAGTAHAGTPAAAYLLAIKRRSKEIMDAVTRPSEGTSDGERFARHVLKATMSGRDTRILLKPEVDGSTDRVLGCHIVGDAAAEAIRAVAIAVQIKRPRPISTRRLRCIRRQEELVTMPTPTARYVREAAAEWGPIGWEPPPKPLKPGY